MSTTDRIYLTFSLGITQATASRLLVECSKWASQGTKEIYLMFAFPGGNVAAGIAAYNALRALPVKLITHNIGNVDSIATIIFLAGAERLSVPHATFMFHGVAFDLSGHVRADLPWLTDKLDSINADHKKMAAIVNDRAKFADSDTILDLFRTQATKQGNWALEHQLIHKIEPVAIPPGSMVLAFGE